MNEEHDGHVEGVLVGVFQNLCTSCVKVGVVSDQVEANDELPESNPGIEVLSWFLLLDHWEQVLEVCQLAHLLDKLLGSGKF